MKTKTVTFMVAVTLSSPALAKFEAVAQTQDSAIFIDTDSVKINGKYASATIVEVMASPKPAPNSKKLYQSIEYGVQFDCPASTMRFIEVFWWESQSKSGQIVDGARFSPEESKWRANIDKFKAAARKACGKQ